MSSMVMSRPPTVGSLAVRIEREVYSLAHLVYQGALIVLGRPGSTSSLWPPWRLCGRKHRTSHAVGLIRAVAAGMSLGPVALPHHVVGESLYPCRAEASSNDIIENGYILRQGKPERAAVLRLVRRLGRLRRNGRGCRRRRGGGGLGRCCRSRTGAARSQSVRLN